MNPRWHSVPVGTLTPGMLCMQNYLKLLFLRIRPQEMVTLIFLSLYIILGQKSNYVL